MATTALGFALALVAITVLVAVRRRRLSQRREADDATRPVIADQTTTSRPSAPTTTRQLDADDPVRSGVFPGRGDYSFVVTCTHYRQDALRDLLLRLGDQRCFSAVLSCSSAPGDPNAVAVQAPDGTTLGFFSTEEAARYQYLVAGVATRGQAATCAAKLSVTEDERRYITLALDLAHPRVAAEALGLHWRYRKTVDKRLREGGRH